MIDRFTQSDLERLMQHRQMPSISIYIPTHRITTYIDQDKILLKNQLAEVEELCIEAGLRRPDVRKILQPGYDLLENTAFWINMSDGLAIFLAENVQEFYRLPRPFPVRIEVARRFHIKPLIPLLTNDGRFYVLAVSQNNVRFLEGSRFAVDEVNLEEVPSSLAEALGQDEFDRQVQRQNPSSVSSGRNNPTLTFHTHGGGEDVNEKNRLLRYFRQIDRGLREYLGDDQTPLIFAGVDYLMPIYQEANTYDHLVEQHIPGNPDDLSAEELHSRAWEIVAPIVAREQEELIEQFNREAGTGRTTVWADEGLIAAFQGRVMAVFLPRGVQTWGIFDPNTMQLQRENAETAENHDLYDLIAHYTLLHNGQVYTVDPERIPGDGEIAAIFRF